MSADSLVSTDTCNQLSKKKSLAGDEEDEDECSSRTPNNNIVYKKKNVPLVSIHEHVLAFLDASKLLAPNQKYFYKTKDPMSSSNNHNNDFKRIHELQKRRIYLASEVARVRSKSELSTIGGRSLSNKTTRTSSFLEEAVSDLGSIFIGQDMTTSNESKEQERQRRPPPNLALSMQNIRKKRKLTAAYRLGGITAGVPHADPEVLSIRFDVCLDGEYVACHHAFFDLILARQQANTGNEDDKKQNRKKSAAATTASKNNATDSVDSDETGNNNMSSLYMRLVQHTIPSPIPLLDICEKTLGGSLFHLGDLNQQSDWQTEEFKRCIRTWCRQIYRACTSLERRKQAWSYLEDYQQQYVSAAHDEEGGQEPPRLLTVNSLASPVPDSLTQICFDMVLQRPDNDNPSKWSTTMILVVDLNYCDPMNEQPTLAAIRPKATTTDDSASKHHDGVDDYNHNGTRREFVQKAQRLFLELPMEEALEQLEQAWETGG
jgi:hypothetical protein